MVIMTKLDELIKTLCPDGVEYITIEDICNISRGKVMSKDYIRDNFGKYPVYSSQTENNGVLGTISTYEYDGEYLTWTTDGANAGSVFYRYGKFSVINVCGLLKVTRAGVLPKYLYYILKVSTEPHVNRGMGNAKLMSNVMAKIKVPVPPMEVQCEIVRILDNFTELTAELTARKKQYEYYRDELLTFDENIQHVKLTDIASICRGVRVVKSQLNNNDTIPVYQNSLTPLGYFYKSNCKANTPFIISAGAAGEIGYSRESFWAADDCFYFQCKPELNNRFLYYTLLSQYSYIHSRVRKASIPRLSRVVIESLRIPLPPLAEQERIVSILDRFDKLCNDISVGLPAEIEARKKQYEYYRDKLLTFEPIQSTEKELV